MNYCWDRLKSVIALCLRALFLYFPNIPRLRYIPLIITKNKMDIVCCMFLSTLSTFFLRPVFPSNSQKTKPTSNKRTTKKPMLHTVSVILNIKNDQNLPEVAMQRKEELAAVEIGTVGL